MKKYILCGLVLLCGNALAEETEAYFSVRVSEVAAIQQLITQQTTTIEKLTGLLDGIKAQRDTLFACVLATATNHKNALTCIGATEL